MIAKTTEDKILGGCDVVDVLDHYHVALKRSGKDYTCLSPFRDDRNYGSFKVSKSRNLVTDYSSDEHWNPVRLVAMFEYGKSDKLTVSEHYPDILRILAEIAHVVILEDGGCKVKSNYVPRPKPEPLKTVYWLKNEVAIPFTRFNDRNPLLRYLRGLNIQRMYKERLEAAIKDYIVATYHNPENAYNEGWSIWWYIDDAGYVRSGKLMKYKPDGHRDKDTNSTWAHSKMARWIYRKDGTREERKRWKYDQDTHEPNLNCLFGQHLMNEHKDAIVCVCESEKTALICSAFSDNSKRIWMATGGKSGLSAERFEPLTRAQRDIWLYPDIDAYDDWAKIVKEDEKLSSYEKLIISPQVKELWTEADGPKADIADIMLRIMVKPAEQTPEQTLAQQVAESMGAPEKSEVIDNMIKTLNLQKI